MLGQAVAIPAKTRVRGGIVVKTRLTVSVIAQRKPGGRLGRAKELSRRGVDALSFRLAIAWKSSRWLS